MSELRERPGDQSLPTPNHRPSIQSLVRADLDQREQVGVQRYGTPLQAHNGRDAARDLYEELLDAACYARQVIAEREQPASLEIARLANEVASRDATIERLVDLETELRRQLVGFARSCDRQGEELKQLKQERGESRQVFGTVEMFAEPVLAWHPLDDGDPVEIPLNEPWVLPGTDVRVGEFRLSTREVPEVSGG